MAEVLSQEEIDQLLIPLPVGFNSVEAFEKYMTKRSLHPEKAYGIFGFGSNVVSCRFFNNKNNENLLADIRKRNEEQGFGNVQIPNTNITLINYSFCPKCKTIYSFNEVINYYKKPKPDTMYKNISNQYRNDTRVLCHNCDTYFLPSLVISDGTPKNEVQFLCRTQTINAVELFMSSKNIDVLTRKSGNIVYKDNLRAIKNDVSIRELEEKPTLITNIIQYTPINLIMNFINGKNVKKGDLLFDEWKEVA